MSNYRKRWVEEYGEIPEGMELHHMLPIRLGGTDDLDNLELVTREEHSQRHFQLYEEHGDPKDLCAAYMLSGEYDSDKRKVCASIGGQIGGKKTYEMGVGIHAGSSEERQEWASMGGKASFASGNNPKWVYWASQQGRMERSSRGGKNGPLCVDHWIQKGMTKKAAQDKIAKIQSDRGKIGGKGNRGKKYVTDGEINKKVHPDHLHEFLQKNPSFYEGRTMTSLKGHKFVNDGKIMKMIDSNDIKKFLLENPTFKMGRIKGNKNENN